MGTFFCDQIHVHSFVNCEKNEKALILENLSLVFEAKLQLKGIFSHILGQGGQKSKSSNFTLYLSLSLSQ